MGISITPPPPPPFPRVLDPMAPRILTLPKKNAFTYVPQAFNTGCMPYYPEWSNLRVTKACEAPGCLRSIVMSKFDREERERNAICLCKTSPLDDSRFEGKL